jgi:selenocysteine lyase/cysteine desulfurase
MRVMRILVPFAALALVPLFFCASLSAQTDGAAKDPAEVSHPPLSPAMDALARTRTLVEKFFEQSSNVVSTENVTQAIIGKNGKSNYREDSVFDYLY